MAIFAKRRRRGGEERGGRVIDRTVGPTTYFVRGTARGCRSLERGFWLEFALSQGFEGHGERVRDRTVGPTTYFVRGTASGCRPLERGFWLEFGHGFAFRLA